MFLSFVPIKLVIKELTGSRGPVGENGSFSRSLMVICSSSTEQGSENLKWDLPDPVSKGRTAALANTSLI